MGQPKYLIDFSVKVEEEDGSIKEIGFNGVGPHESFAYAMFEAEGLLENHMFFTELPWEEFQAELKRLKESDP